jgi:tetratricopeptide (TPR) repeat protein
VPGGELIGDAVAEGSVDELGALASQLSGSVLALESGAEVGRVEYLAGVPNEALEAYLEGWRLYRETAYLPAREAFSRALVIDGTFALAAMGLRDAASMGLDQGRGAISARATSILRSNLDHLPPRDRAFLIARLGDADAGRRSSVEVIRDADALAQAYPDRAEAWYRLGDRLFHDAEYVALPDAWEQARAAWDRALEIDPGLLVVRQHRLWLAGLTRDTAYFEVHAPAYLAVTAGNESESGVHAMHALVFGDEASETWVRNTLATGSSEHVVQLAGWQWWGPAAWSPEFVDLSLEALDRSATPGELAEAVGTRYRVLKNAGRNREALVERARLEELTGPDPIARILENLYWDGDDEAAQIAAQSIAADLDGAAGALSWNSGGAELCVLTLWRLRSADESTVAGAIERLRAGADDPDPSHGWNSLCFLVLEAALADVRGEGNAGTLVAEIKRVMGLGPAGGADYANFELARMLEARGDFAGAMDAAFSHRSTEISPFYMSTMLREVARLADLARESEQALEWYRSVLTIFAAADPEYDEELARMRARVAELEAELGASR